MNGPYVGVQIFELPLATGLTGSEFTAVWQSGQTRKTYTAAFLSGEGGTISSVSLSMPNIFSVSGSPITSGSGTFVVNIVSQNPNLFWAGPPTGSSASAAFRAISGVDLPLPTPLTLGGIESISAVAHNWITSISQSGAPNLAQPAFSDISGILSTTQIPALSYITQLSTGSGLSGGPITGSGTVQFAQIAASSLLANATTSLGIPVATTLGPGLAFSGTTIINTSGAADGVISILFQSGLSGATITGSGTVGINNLGVTTSMLAANAVTYAKIQQTSSNVLLGNPTVTGNVVEITLGGGLGFSGSTLINLSGSPDGVLQVSTGTGLAGGPITSSGTILFAAIAANSFWANVSTATSTPVVAGFGSGIAISGNNLVNTFNSSIAGITIDGGGVVFTTGGKGYVQIPYNCTISSWAMLGNLTGSATVDIQRCTYTAFPAFFSMVGAGNLPTLAAAQKNSAAPASWSSITILASDVLQFSVSTVSALTRLNLQLNLVRF